MDVNQLLTDLLSFANSLYGIVQPIIIVMLLILLFTPKLLENHDPMKAAHIVFCYLMEAVGVVLMSLGALPTCMAVLSPEGLAPQVYLGLLLVFAAGGILFLWHDQYIRDADEELKRIPRTLYIFTLKIVGHISVLFSALSFALAVTLGSTQQEGWWVYPIVILIYGCILCWLTSPFQISITPVRSPVKKAAKRTTAKKSSTRKKRKK